MNVILNLQEHDKFAICKSMNRLTDSQSKCIIAVLAVSVP